MSTKIALSLEAAIDQSINDHFSYGFSNLDLHQSYPLFHGGVRYILSKSLPANTCKVRLVQRP
eukprot:scaffold10357_cov66-Attheya_sp.AAC.2